MRKLIIIALILVVSCTTFKKTPKIPYLSFKYRITNIKFFGDSSGYDFLFSDTIPPFILQFEKFKLKKGIIIGDITLKADTVNKSSNCYCNAKNGIHYNLNLNTNYLYMFFDYNDKLETLGVPYFGVIRRAFHIQNGTINFNIDSLTISNFYNEKGVIKESCRINAIKCR